MAKLTVDFSKTLGKIKPMHGVGHPPMLGMNFTHLKYLKDAHIPYSRLHDIGGAYGGNVFVDVPNIFRDFDADENDPDSYMFVFTDKLLEALVENGCEPYFRLGPTIENNMHLKAFNIYPPKDFAKWARVCEHIIRHYNEGWANGYHFNIKYWEIWCETDEHDKTHESGTLWLGTKEQYFDLYAITSKHLKECFGDSIKVGGYGSTGLYSSYLKNEEAYDNKAFSHFEELLPFSYVAERAYYRDEFFAEFIERVKKDNLPFDFFSHHSYMCVENTRTIQEDVEQRLKDAGLENVEIHLNEWNNHRQFEHRGTSGAAAHAMAMMCAMQNTKMAVMTYYDARIGVSQYGGLFNPLTYKPFCAYYSFMAFGELYVMGNQAAIECNEEDVYCLAAKDDSGKTCGIVLTNIGDDRTIESNIPDDFKAYLIDSEHMMTEVELNNKNFVLEKEKTYYFTNKA